MFCPLIFHIFMLFLLADKTLFKNYIWLYPYLFIYFKFSFFLLRNRCANSSSVRVRCGACLALPVRRLRCVHFCIWGPHRVWRRERDWNGEPPFSWQLWWVWISMTYSRLISTCTLGLEFNTKARFFIILITCNFNFKFVNQSLCSWVQVIKV